MLCVFFAYFAVNFSPQRYSEGTEFTEIKYYFECFLDLSLLIQPLYLHKSLLLSLFFIYIAQGLQ
ncbi:MAG: hypothetical protein JWR09_1899 [Mucilaginibacter sp.]|nr:hypothetical protein [Mucilaginibacter sp.]